ncbi:prepilin-type N-terminal cleavage/methylation domain-containing protein [Desulfoluna sp.]|uniref:type IV pilus modification PilV family protein n=1 Tax=Desulfoluna sp. TaxID=2045199 RepID=UPI00261B8845|nr:prepilin-type N-terminal cleavage/methylation domain-containing protein [Desulfoluna sp.]
MQKSNNEEGMTLIEVMVTMVIFAVGILGIMTLQLNALRTNAETRHWDDANRLLAFHAERIGLSTYGSLNNTGSVEGTADKREAWRKAPFGDNSVGVTIDVGPGGYALSRFVSENTTEMTKTVFFCVQWTLGTRQEQIFRTVVKSPDREG